MKLLAALFICMSSVSFSAGISEPLFSPPPWKRADVERLFRGSKKPSNQDLTGRWKVVGSLNDGGGMLTEKESGSSLEFASRPAHPFSVFSASWIISGMRDPNGPLDFNPKLGLFVRRFGRQEENIACRVIRRGKLICYSHMRTFDGKFDQMVYYGLLRK